MSDPLDALMAQHGATDPNAGTAPPAVGVLGHPRVSSDGPPSTLDSLNAMLGPFAHPQTLTDVARLLTIPVDSVKKALATAVSAHSARQAAADALTATGRGVERVGIAVDKPTRYVGAYELLHDPVKGAATLAAPSVLKGGGQLMQRAGAALSGESVPLSVADEAALLKQGYSPTMIERVKAQMAPRPTTAVSAEPPASPRGAPAAPVVADARTAPPRSPSAPSPSAATAAEVAKPHLAAAEMTEYVRLVKTGKTPQQALQLIQMQRDLVQRLGLPSSETVRAAVADRNVSGRWPE